MAAIPEVVDPTLAAIDRELERRAALEPRRSYLGASSLGEPCERKLWYSIQPDVPREPRRARLIKAANDGHRTEEVMADLLRAVPGVELWTRQDDGSQYGFTDLGGRFGGHIDGVIRGLLQAPETPHIWECKASERLGEFRKPKSSLGEKHALRAWDENYYAQAVIYMDYFDLTRHYLTVCAPGARDFDSCRTEANPDMAKALRMKAKRIIDAAEPPARISDRPEFYRCKWCDFREVCHAGK